jgi:hypothetical protein
MPKSFSGSSNLMRMLTKVSGAAQAILLSVALHGMAAAQSATEASRPFVSGGIQAQGGAGLDRTMKAGRPGRNLWIASVAALTAATVADGVTSWNKREGNRMLAGSGGTFGAKGVAIKGGVNALWIVGQVVALRRNASHRTLALVNIAGASVLGAIAYRNSGIGTAGGGLSGSRR